MDTQTYHEVSMWNNYYIWHTLHKYTQMHEIFDPSNSKAISYTSGPTTIQMNGLLMDSFHAQMTQLSHTNYFYYLHIIYSRFPWPRPHLTCCLFITGILYYFLRYWDVFICSFSRLPIHISCVFVVDMTGSSTRCPLRSHSLVHSENNYYFVGIWPICDIELIYFFRQVCFVGMLDWRQV